MGELWKVLVLKSMLRIRTVVKWKYRQKLLKESLPMMDVFFHFARLGGIVDARTVYMHFRTKDEDVENIFRNLDEIVNKTDQEEDESEKALSDHKMIKETSKVE
ncbi:hypothetical protein QQ045_026076 [Rhodiola kirilowii]